MVREYCTIFYYIVRVYQSFLKFIYCKIIIIKSKNNNYYTCEAIHFWSFVFRKTKKLKSLFLNAVSVLQAYLDDCKNKKKSHLDFSSKDGYYLKEDNETIIIAIENLMVSMGLG